MAESFTNALVSSIGIQTSSNDGTVGVGSTEITGISTGAVSVGDLVVNQHFRGNTKVVQVGVSSVYTDNTSTNTGLSTSQLVQFLGVTTAYTASEKSILVGGTFVRS